MGVSNKQRVGGRRGTGGAGRRGPGARQAQAVAAKGKAFIRRAVTGPAALAKAVGQAASLDGRGRVRLAARLTWAVVALQAALLLTLFVTPDSTPIQAELFELLWAASRTPMFYPLVAVILISPPLTIAAFLVPGVHRVWLALSWIAFLTLAMGLWSERLAVMLRVVWWRVNNNP